MFRVYIYLALVATLLFTGVGFAAVAHADTISYTDHGELNGQNVYISSLQAEGSAGMVTLIGVVDDTTGAALNISNTWCVDLYAWLLPAGQFGDILQDPFTPQINRQIAALISNGTPLLADDYNVSAALQVAIWTVEYGNTITITPDNPDVASLALSYVNHVLDGSWVADPNTTLEVLFGSGPGIVNQDQAFLLTTDISTELAAVLEPSSMIIIVTGLMMLIAVLLARKRPPGYMPRI